MSASEHRLGRQAAQLAACSFDTRHATALKRSERAVRRVTDGPSPRGKTKDGPAPDAASAATAPGMGSGEDGSAALAAHGAVHGIAGAQAPRLCGEDVVSQCTHLSFECSPLTGRVHAYASYVTVTPPAPGAAPTSESVDRGEGADEGGWWQQAPWTEHTSYSPDELPLPPASACHTTLPASAIDPTTADASRDRPPAAADVARGAAIFLGLWRSLGAHHRRRLRGRRLEIGHVRQMLCDHGMPATADHEANSAGASIERLASDGDGVVDGNGRSVDGGRTSASGRGTIGGALTLSDDGGDAGRGAPHRHRDRRWGHGATADPSREIETPTRADRSPGPLPGHLPSRLPPSPSPQPSRRQEPPLSDLVSRRRQRPRFEVEEGAPAEIRWGFAHVHGRRSGATMPLAVSADGHTVLCLACYTPLHAQPTGFTLEPAAASPAVAAIGGAVASPSHPCSVGGALSEAACQGGPEAHPHNDTELFCGGACRARYVGRRCTDSLRRQVAALDGAVCAVCGLDASALCQVLSEASPGRSRAATLERLAPAIAAEPRLAARLLDAPHLEGHAWHADHKLAVRDGGGECTVHNMQVLCVACHLRKTNAERRARAASPHAPEGSPSGTPTRARTRSSHRKGAVQHAQGTP